MNTQKVNSPLLEKLINDCIGEDLDETEIFCRCVKLRLSTYAHFATFKFAFARGYVRKHEGKIELYNGRYGYGVKIHHPNCAFCKPSGKHSNRSHVVEYVLIYLH